ncbi:MAG: hypothetical protein OCD76_08040 [Reichenbachiella sp.]
MRRKLNILFILFFVGHTYVQAQDTYDLAMSHYLKGNKAVANLQFELAEVYYDSAIGLDAGKADYYAARGQAKDFEGDEVGAIEDFNTAMKLSPNHTVAIYKKALVHFKKEKFKESARELTMLINSLESFETEMVVYKGVSFHDFGGNQIFAVSTLQELLADVYAHRAIIYDKLGYKTSALVDFDKAIELNEHDPNYYVNRGVFRLDRGNKTGAIYDFRTALKINPHHTAALYNLSFLVDDEERDAINMILFGAGDKARSLSKTAFEHYQKGKYELALVYYDSALVIKADNASDLMNRGIVKVKMGNYQAAIKDFNSSVYSDNSLLRNYMLIGDAYQEINDYNYAIKYYDRYLKNAGPDGKVYYSMGVAYMKFNKDKEACLTFRKAIEMGEERAEEPMDDVCF